MTTTLRRAFLGALALAAIALTGAAQGKPYSLDDLVGLLKKKVASTRVLTLAKQNCISFNPNSFSDDALRKAGGTAALNTGLRDACSPAHPRAAVDSAHRVMPGAVMIPVASVPADTLVTVYFRAAVVGADMTVRPLPQLDLWIISPKNDTARASTDLEGKLQKSLKPGVYRVESTVDISGQRYRWAFFAQVAKDMAPIELTQKNAAVEAIAGPAAPVHDTVKVVVAAPVKKDLTEREIFERDRTGLFTVYGAERGTGFLVDSAGLVMTTLHLVDYADEVRVMVDSVTKVYARVIAKDREKDVAVLAINPKRCAKCVVLHFPDSAHSATPGPGDRVLAFGSPLNKLGVFSLGIVSNADPLTIVSDVNVTYLNSGGPLLSKDGFVIGLNSDRTAANSGGTRMETSVALPVLLSTLARARDSIPALAAKPVSDELLPIVPRAPFPAAPIDAVKGIGSSLRLDPYYLTDEGYFQVMMMTPQIAAWRQQQALDALAQKKQDDPKRYASLTKIDPIQGWNDWDELLSERKAVVVFNVMPEDAEFPFYQPDKIQNVTDGSVKDMKIFRDGVEIIPVERVRFPAQLNLEQLKAAGKAVAMQAVYIYRVNDFAPRAVGTVATYTVTITDAYSLKQTKLTLKPEMIEQMWKDFTAYQYGGRQ